MAEGILNPIPQLEADFDFDVYTKQEVDALLDEKADKVDTYTKTETDTLLSAKADADNVYTKTETDNLLNGKADKSTTLAGYGIADAYTKTQTDNLLNGKADADSVYTKSEIDTKIPNGVGSTTKPVYVNGGVVSACTYELNKTVPANAVFTDTTYTAGNGLNLSGASFSAKAGTNVTVNTSGINVNGNGVVASADSGLISGGTAYTELRPTLDGTWVKNAQTTAINLQKLEGGIEYLYGLLSHQYDQLKKYINGNYYDYDTDTDSKYVKTVPAGAMPYASLDSVGGKTVVWNQLMYDGNFTDATVWRAESASYSATSVANNELSITVIQTPTAFYNLGARRGNYFTSYVAGHKYLMQMEVYLPYASSAVVGRSPNIIDNASGQLTIASNVVANTWTQCSGIFTAKQANNTDIYIAPNTFANYQVGDVWKMRNYILVDLTLLYGAGNEPTTVAEFTAQFPAQYYPYNAGQLLSAGVTEVKSVGKNLLNTQRTVEVSLGYTSNTTKRNLAENQVWKGFAYSGYTNQSNIASYTLGNGTLTYKSTTNGYGIGFPIKVKPNTKYTMQCVKGTASGFFVVQYSADGYLTSSALNNLSADSYTYTTTATTEWLMVGFACFSGSQNTDITVNDIMVTEAETTSTYSPYQENTYPIPAEIRNLEGYGWSAGSVYNYIDFDRKVFVQRVGSIDLAIANMNNIESFPGWTSSGIKALIGAGINTQIINSLCVMQNTKAFNANTVGGNDIVFLPLTVYGLTQSQWLANYPNLVLRFYFPLNHAIETDISAYITDDNLIEVESGGTLTFPNANGDDYRIPVPSSETYMVDLQSAL